MTGYSFHQLDEQLKKTKTSDLIALNQMGERNQIVQQGRLQHQILMVTTLLSLLVAIFGDFAGTLQDYSQLVLFGLSLVLLIWSYFREGRMVLIALAIVLLLTGTYNALILPIIIDSFSMRLLLMGIFQILFALYEIQQARHLSRLNPQAVDQQDFYDAVYAALLMNQPNNSNQLIELRELTQTITIWLRPNGVVLLLEQEKRLYFDVHRSFKLEINGTDSGGDMVPIIAHIIDQPRRCRISRHAWLRYTRFAM